MESRGVCAEDRSFDNTAAQHPPRKMGAGREADSPLVPRQSIALDKQAWDNYIQSLLLYLCLDRERRGRVG